FNHFELQKFLGTKGIPCMIYYPVPLHTQVAYKTAGMKHEDFEVTNALCESVFSLPMHTELTDEQLKYITESVLEFVTK
ncbi:MAG: DegT/DnrJ/EryC1/StrS family aminotransferase, partial [Bacteroidetes bacterium]|nr:DegT/DnrJ/EryC1/StrS family aminotransferase [Bacteroidota bacterium]